MNSFIYKGKKYNPTIYFPTDYNRVDGLVMGYGKRWATIKPTAMSLETSLLWGTASKELQYTIIFERQYMIIYIIPYIYTYNILMYNILYTIYSIQYIVYDILYTIYCI